MVCLNCTAFFLHREDEIAANLLKMDLELKQWQTRVDARNRVAEKERQRREKVLADVSAKNT